MKNILISILMTFGILNAGLIDSVALVVNDEPITLYDIDKKMSNSKISKAQAVSILVDELLYNQELEKNNISVDIFDINSYLEQMAANNNMDLYQFKSIIRQKYPDYSTYEENIKKQLLRQKFVNKVLRGNLKLPTDEDLKIYYDNNMNSFSTASKFHITQYSTKNKRSLLAIQKNPMVNTPDVQRETVVLDQSKLNAKFRYLLNDTKERNFTPIFTANKNFVMIYISKKEDTATQNFNDVKNDIFQKVMSEKEKKYLQEYFEKIKLTADIKVIR